MQKAKKKVIPYAVIFAVSVLALVFIFVCTNTFILSSIIGDIETRVVNAELEGGSMMKIHEDFLKSRTYLGITVNHEDIAEVEEEFAEILGSLRIGDTQTAEIAKSRLISALGHLKRLCGFNIDSII